MRIERFFVLIPLLLFFIIPVIKVDAETHENNKIAESVKKIAFTSKRNGNFDIYTINSDGSNLKRLTNSKNDELKPQWSPDGTKIMYLSKNRKKTAIMVMNSDGSDQKMLAEDCVAEYTPLWSPDSSRILFVAKTKSKKSIYTINADGSELRCLSEAGTEGVYPSWSPDGSRILCLVKYRNERHIYSMTPDGTERQKITLGKEAYQAPIWSSKGDKIAFISTKKTLLGTYNQINIMNSDGSNLITIADGSKKVENIDYNDVIYWSPDSATIAFTKVAKIEAHVSESGSVSFSYLYGTYIIGIDGNSHEFQLGKSSNERAQPGWSPDSLKIALVSNSKLIIYDMKTRIENEIPVNVSLPLSPIRWSPDGSKLIFAGKDSSFQKSTLYLVTIDGKVNKLSEANDYDPVWAPE